MKAEIIKDRPDYELFKQNDIVSFYHLQLPRWLLEDSRYVSLSLEAKFTYTLLFNRFQLSKHNGWINDNGEVFVIYTRKELSEKLNVSEKRISAAMNELKEYMLIWERRCGRGFANQIYLANVKISLADAIKSKSGPLDPPQKAKTELFGNLSDPLDMSTDIETENGDEERDGNVRNDETAGLNNNKPENKTALFAADVDTYVDTYVDKCPISCLFSSKPYVTAGQEPPEQIFKNRQNVRSRTADSDLQEPPNRLSSNIDFSYKELSIYNQSQSESSPFFARARMDGLAGQTDADAIKKLLEQAELYTLEDGDASVMRDAIERLYYMQSIKIGGAVYPNDSIRTNLLRLDSFVVQDAVYKITNNTTTKIRNSSAYVVTVLFNTIMESGSDKLVDPYLNFLRAKPGKDTVWMGGG